MDKVSLELIITIIFSAIGVGKWIYEYTKKMKWERTKFLSDKVESFLTDPEIKKVLTILDWNSATIVFKDQLLKYNDYMVMESLITHNYKTTYTKEEKYIRELFDYFLDELSKFQIWIDTGLIEEKQTKRFLGYYLNIMSGKRKSKSDDYIKSLKTYIEYYGYDIKIINYER